MNEIRTQPTPDSRLDEIVGAIEKETNLRFLGKVVISSQDFKRWPWLCRKSTAMSSSRISFFVLPAHAVLVELHLTEKYVLWDMERWCWTRYWKVVLRGIVPWEQIEEVEYNPRESGMRMRHHNGLSWSGAQMLHGYGRRIPIQPGGDLQALTAELSIHDKDAEALPPAEFADTVAGGVKAMLQRSGLLQYALKGAIPHLQGMFPDLEPCFEYRDCANAFWAQYPHKELLRHCIMPVCAHEFEKHARTRRNGHYREFLHRLRKADRELARKARGG